MTTITLLIAIASFALGAASVIGAGLLIERRVLARPGGRVAVAIRLLDESARIGGGK